MNYCSLCGKECERVSLEDKIISSCCESSVFYEPENPEITLRDQFAIAAMPEIVAQGTRGACLAKESYEIADAMMKERRIRR